jgi:hypothetical protein
MEDLSIQEMTELRGGRKIHIPRKAHREGALSNCFIGHSSLNNSFNTSNGSIGGLSVGGNLTINVSGVSEED